MLDDIYSPHYKIFSDGTSGLPYQTDSTELWSVAISVGITLLHSKV